MPCQLNHTYCKQFCLGANGIVGYIAKVIKISFIKSLSTNKILKHNKSLYIG